MEFWVSTVKIISILASGAFGSIGLLTKYRDEETHQITTWGKVALAGIAFTSVLSLTLQTLETSKEAAKREEAAVQSANEAKKAEESSKATSERLETILATAKITSEQQNKSLDDSNLLKSELQKALDQQNKNLAQTEIITGKMDDSLTTQNVVLTGNKQILQGVGEGAKRDTNNTIGILRTIWNESNRIEANQITAVITYTFSRETSKAPPFLFNDGETLSLSAISGADAPPAFPLNTWSSNHLLSNKELFLTAKEQKISRKQYSTVDGPYFIQTSYFSSFYGDIKDFTDKIKWDGASIEVLLVNQDSHLVGELKSSLEWDPSDLEMDDFEREYDIPQGIKSNDDYQIVPLPVRAKMVIYLRERPIAESEAVLARVKEHDEDVRSLIVAKFKITKIPVDTFPHFQPTF